MAEPSGDIAWRLHLKSERHRVFAFLSTDSGRASFWAERTEQQGDRILFRFPNGERIESRVIEEASPWRFVLTYFNDSVVRFELSGTADGTLLLLRETGIREDEVDENRAGWVSVLMNLKAQADFGIDLRNHDPARTWSEGYVDN